MKNWPLAWDGQCAPQALVSVCKSRAPGRRGRRVAWALGVRAGEGGRACSRWWRPCAGAAVRPTHCRPASSPNCVYNGIHSSWSSSLYDLTSVPMSLRPWKRLEWAVKVLTSNPQHQTGIWALHVGNPHHISPSNPTMVIFYYCFVLWFLLLSVT